MARANPDLPTAAEIAALTARLRELSNAGASADPAERARFLADKDALLDRITANQHADRGAAFAAAALADVTRAQAEDGGYALVGPSARTWRADPTTGQPIEPASEAEHRALRQMLGREQLSTTEPTWTDNGEIVCTVIPAADEPDGYEQAGTDTAGDEQGAADEPGLTGGEGPLIDAGPALTAEEAAHELAADGRSLVEARALVRDYLDDVSEHVGASAHLWGLDDADLDAIRAGEAAQVAEAVEAAHNVVAAHVPYEADVAASTTVDEYADETMTVDGAGL